MMRKEAVPSDHVELESLFNMLDQNGDGKISPPELQSCIKAVGAELSAEEVEAFVGWIDTDGDGLLGREDVVRLVDVDEEEDEVRVLKKAFKAYEMEGQGCITAKSLRRALCRLGERKTTQEREVTIEKFDVNGDGVINFEEFRLMMLF